MTRAAAVSILADILDQGDRDEDAIYEEMARAGIPSALADRTYKFMQIACGRAFLADLGVRFSADYVCLNASGEVIESGTLDGEPTFVSAQRLLSSQTLRHGFAKFALMSADVAAVNKALHNGSDPKNLFVGPSLLFMEPPTPAGLEAAARLTAEGLAARRESPKAQKLSRPWWRFWS